MKKRGWSWAKVDGNVRVPYMLVAPLGMTEQDAQLRCDYWNFKELIGGL